MSKLIKSHGWNRNLLLSNGRIECVITLDVGPRIIRFAHVDGLNIFKEYPEQLGHQEEPAWMIRGGHRLWIAPEADYCYLPDNSTVQYQSLSENHVLVQSSSESTAGWEKEMEIKMESDTDQVTVTHRMTATKDLDFPVALWALSVMAPGGVAIIPQPALGNHANKSDLLPNQTMVLWPYTDLQDKRLSLGRPNILVQQKSDSSPTKFGLLHQLNWVGYQLQDTLFAKTVPVVTGATYPDRGVNFELFTNKDMLEIESLAPLVLMKKGQTVQHQETWALKKVSSPNWQTTSLLDHLP